MTTSIISILVAAAGSVGAYFAWKSSAVRQRRLAEKDVAEEEEAREKAKAEIEAAVYGKDDEKVNAIVAKLLAPVVMAAICAACASRPAPVYIPTDRKIESTTNSIGIACKAVPDAVFAEMLVRLQELDELKRETKVSGRVGK